RETTVRTVHSLTLEKQGEEITLEIVGDGFLYNMVRIITGTLVDVGSGKIPAEEMKKILAGKDRTKAGHTAPPQGLYLQEVYY
ncbi:MAG: tRNA pseudouridine(38-40) synthase TruA, partial [Anaerovoracaceae bacterium]